MAKAELTEKQRLWHHHLQACSAAGLSMKDYAEQHGLKLQTFYYWNKYLKRLGVAAPENSACFVKAVRRDPYSDAGKTRISLSNGVSIEVSHDFDTAAMVDLLCAARRL